MTRDEAKLKAMNEFDGGWVADSWREGFDAGWAAAITMLAEHAPEIWSMSNLAPGDGFGDAIDRIEASIREWGAE
jgi:hypothetical protein